MTYTIKEFNEILKQTDFNNSFNIVQIELGNLPIYVRLELRKQKFATANNMESNLS